MRKLARSLAALLAAPVLLLLALAPGARAQEPSDLTIRNVDATDPQAVEVTFSYAGDRDDVADLTVRERGDQVESTMAVPLSDQQSLGIVLAIDVSGSMAEGALIERVLEAAQAFIQGKAAGDQIAIVSFSGEVRLVQDFTTNEATLLASLEKLALARETSVYDAIVRSATLFDDSELQPNVVVFSDGGDTSSTASADRAKAAVESVGGALFALGVENDDFGVLQRMATETGGTATTADDPAGVAALFERVQATLQKQYVVQYTSRVDSGAVPITLSVGDDQATAEVIVGSEQSGTARLQPQEVAKPSGPGFLRSPLGLVIGLGLVLVAVTVIALNLGTTFLGRENTLDTALSPYGEGFVPAEESGFDTDETSEGPAAAIAQSAIFKRAVKATGEFAERQGFLEKVESKLERANLPLRPAEAIFFYMIGVIVVGLLLLVVTANPIGALIGVGILALVPPAVLSFLASRRQKAFDAQLPDMLQLLASTLRAGYSLMQGVEAVSQEVGEPIGRELRRVVTEARLGRPLEDSLQGVADRMASGDFGWAVMAIRIQREVGGNLAELLVTVAETMTERERLRRDVNALTAEGRISAIVLGILPIGIGGFILGANPGYLDPLFDTGIGKGMLVAGVLLMVGGFYWMKKTIEIEI